MIERQDQETIVLVIFGILMVVFVRKSIPMLRWILSGALTLIAKRFLDRGKVETAFKIRRISDVIKVSAGVRR